MKLREHIARNPIRSSLVAGWLIALALPLLLALVVLLLGLLGPDSAVVNMVGLAVWWIPALAALALMCRAGWLTAGNIGRRPITRLSLCIPISLGYCLTVLILLGSAFWLAFWLLNLLPFVHVEEIGRVINT